MKENAARPDGRTYFPATALATSGFVLALSSLCFLAFLLDAPAAAAIFPKAIPMAPSTAGCFALLACALLLWQSSYPWKQGALKAAAALVLVISAVVFIKQLRTAPQFASIPLWKMSPFTAALFMVSAAGLLRVARLKAGPDPASIAAGSLIMAFSSLILLGYLYGSPLFYGGTFIPVAFTTGLAFLAFSVALFASDRESLLATPFFGDSLKAVLFRNFLPLTVGAVLLGGALDRGGPALFGSRPALNALYALLAMAAAAWLVRRVAKRVGDRLALAQLELEKANRELADSKQDMESLLYVTTHDLRGPLVNIHGFGQRAAEDLDKLRTRVGTAAAPEEVRAAANELTGGRIQAALNIIAASARNMDKVINTLLKVSRLGRVEMRPEKLDAGTVLKNVLDTLRYQLNESGCVVKTGDLPPCRADAGALNHIFTNLLSNAIRYRDKNRKLEISVRGERTGGTVRYSVTDNGLGIKDKDLPGIWRLFHSGSVPGAEKGEGIGLPMIKRLVEKNSGRLWAESEEGEGSVFYVELPAGDADAQGTT